MALGAARADIARLAVARGVWPIAAGLLAGAAGSFAVSKALESLVFGVATRDPLSLSAAVIIVSIGGLIAVAAPARRAMQVDPAVTLRE
jgi:ABC-type antimicrobial peptide transport system permease subunit